MSKERDRAQHFTADAFLAFANATPEELSRAFRQQALKLHPDKGGDTAAFQKAQAAYETLFSDSQRREGGPQGGGSGGSSSDRGANADQPAGAPRSADYKSTIFVTLEEAYSGTQRTLQVPKIVTCSQCEGAGCFVAPTARAQRLICPSCHGKCLWAGMQIHTVVVQPGQAPTALLTRLTEAAGCTRAGQTPGDVLLGVQVLKHPVFRRRAGSNVDLETDVVVSPCSGHHDGVTCALRLLDGRVFTLKSESVGRRRDDGPATGSPETRIVAGEGMPRYGGRPGERGDLYVHLTTLALPEALTRRKLALHTAEQAEQRAKQAADEGARLAQAARSTAQKKLEVACYIASLEAVEPAAVSCKELAADHAQIEQQAALQEELWVPGYAAEAAQAARHVAALKLELLRPRQKRNINLAGWLLCGGMCIAAAVMGRVEKRRRAANTRRAERPSAQQQPQGQHPLHMYVPVGGWVW